MPEQGSPISPKRTATSFSLELLHGLADKARDIEMTYKGRKTEFTFERLLYGLLLGRGFKVERQVPASYRGINGRIDLRIGGEKTGVFLEIAPHFAASQNVTELHKLTKQTGFKRILILANLTAQPVDLEKLKRNYDRVPASKGRFTRYHVHVLYIGPTKVEKTGVRQARSFIWHPRAADRT